ncbi:cytidylyltransferase domain-containing protein [Candidatus Omnitrophota bacterium]
MKKKEILAVIPARGGSKGIPWKNLAELCGKPLIQYTVEAAQASALLSRTILSSDDDRIIDYCKKQDIETPFKRPNEFAQDDSPMIDVIKHAVNFLGEKEGYKPDFIVLLQPTSPLRETRHIDEALEKLINSEADSIVSVVEIPHSCTPASIMEFDGAYLKRCVDVDEKDLLRQKKPRSFARNGPAVLAFTIDCLVNKNSMYGDKILPFFMKKEESVDIDEKLDLKIAECIMKTTDNK